MMNSYRSQIPRIVLAASLGLAVTGACATGNKGLEPEARQAIGQTRGLCPTDLNQADVAVVETPQGVKMVFTSEDPSKDIAMTERVAELGEALSMPHPAISEDGDLVQHTAVSNARIEDVEDGVALELTVEDPARRPVLLAQAEDHARMLRRGECPTMTDETVRTSETDDWQPVDR